MKRKLIAALLFAASTAGVLVATPATAAQIGTVTFDGSANVGPGLTYPGTPGATNTCANYTVYGKVVVGSTKTKTNTDLGPMGNGCTEANWSFSSNLCVEDHTAPKLNGKAPAAAGLCLIQASGTLNGWCGASSGEGTGFLIDSQGQLHKFRITWATSEGGTLPIVGQITKLSTGQTGPITAEVTAVPVPNTTTIPFGNSCSNPNDPASVFSITGEASYLEV